MPVRKNSPPQLETVFKECHPKISFSQKYYFFGTDADDLRVKMAQVWFFARSGFRKHRNRLQFAPIASSLIRASISSFAGFGSACSSCKIFQILVKKWILEEVSWSTENNFSTKNRIAQKHSILVFQAAFHETFSKIWNKIILNFSNKVRLQRRGAVGQYKTISSVFLKHYTTSESITRMLGMIFLVTPKHCDTNTMTRSLYQQSAAWRVFDKNTESDMIVNKRVRYPSTKHGLTALLCPLYDIDSIGKENTWEIERTGPRGDPRKNYCSKNAPEFVNEQRPSND